MTQHHPEPGDIVIYTVKNTFPKGTDEQRKGVVENVDAANNEIDLGIDGVVPLDRIVEIQGQSPSTTD